MHTRIPASFPYEKRPGLLYVLREVEDWVSRDVLSGTAALRKSAETLQPIEQAELFSAIGGAAIRALFQQSRWDIPEEGGDLPRIQ